MPVVGNSEHIKVSLDAREIPSLEAIAAEKSGLWHGTDRLRISPIRTRRMGNACFVYRTLNALSNRCSSCLGHSSHWLAAAFMRPSRRWTEHFARLREVDESPRRAGSRSF